MFYLTEAEQRVLLIIAIVITAGATIGLTVKKFPFLRQMTTLIDSTDLYPKVDINKASQQQLVDLPSIGETTAAAIIEYRKRVGPFKSIDDLRGVPGISSGKLAKLKPYLKIK